ncbi:uncharacterized protein LOC106657347 isoform X1 [Trichogramma pretiosum]|uniref:uncharacterized protein LOC106657347 isoform X1 n=1 Tax=Trichogramma pretiosum TaxID=7493 RepID=UPI0006C94D71|nr:uncharacterized protein LOC106657347 isoform X1 [Trichogramma pretiosum]
MEMLEPMRKKLKVSREIDKNRRERLRQQLKLIEKRGPYALIDERIHEMSTGENLNRILCDAVRGLSYATINSICRAKLVVDKLPGDQETAIHILPKIGNFDRICFIYKVFECYNNFINFSDPYGFTHLHASVILGLLDVVKFMLKQKMDINVSLKLPKINPRPECEVTPLFLALQHHKTDIVKLLLKKGAKVDTRGLMNETPLHVTCSDYGQRSEYFQTYKNEGVQMSEFYDCKLQFDYIRLLIQKGCQVNAQDTFGNTPLFNLLGNTKRHPAQVGALELLLKSGAEVNILNAKNENAMHELCRSGDLYRQSLEEDDECFDDPIGVRLATALIEYGIDFNVINIQGQTPLQVAVNHLNFDLVKLLLGKNAYFGSVHFLSGPIFGNFKVHEPTWKAIHVFFNIIDVLLGHGFEFDLQRIIEVMKYFNASKNLNEVDAISGIQESISSAYLQYRKLISVAVENDLLKTLDHYFTKMIEEADSLYKYSRDSYIYTLIFIQLGIMRLSDVFKNDAYEILERIENTQAYIDWIKTYKYFSAMEEINKIMKRAKNIALLKYFTCEDYLFLSDVTERYIAKFLVRDFFLHKGKSWLKFCWADVEVPDKCLDNILKYMSNEDICSMLELNGQELNNNKMIEVFEPY